MSDINKEEPEFIEEEGNVTPEQEEYSTLVDRKEQARKQWSEKWDIENGIDPYASPLGESLSSKTTKSYAALNLAPQDTPYYASRRYLERSKNNLIGTGKPLHIDTTVTRIMRLKNSDTGKEFLVYNYSQSWKNNFDAPQQVDYQSEGAVELVEGSKVRDIHTNAVKRSEITGYKISYTIPFSKKNLQDILDKNTTDKKPSLAVAHCRIKGRLHSQAVYKSPSYAIKNIDDFRNASFVDLIQLGERGLSGEKSSIHRLKSPVMSDPASSLWRKSLPVQQAIIQQQAVEE